MRDIGNGATEKKKQREKEQTETWTIQNEALQSQRASRWLRTRDFTFNE